MYVIVQGTVKAYSKGNEIAKYREGDSFGEQELLFMQPRSCSFTYVLVELGVVRLCEAAEGLVLLFAQGGLERHGGSGWQGPAQGHICLCLLDQQRTVLDAVLFHGDVTYPGSEAFLVSIVGASMWKPVMTMMSSLYPANCGQCRGGQGGGGFNLQRRNPLAGRSKVSIGVTPNEGQSIFHASPTHCPMDPSANPMY